MTKDSFFVRLKEKNPDTFYAFCKELFGEDTDRMAPSFAERASPVFVEPFLAWSAAEGRLADCESCVLILTDLTTEVEFQINSSGALAGAAEHGHSAVVEFLLCHGACPLIEHRGKRPSVWAGDFNHHELKTRLESAEAVARTKKMEEIARAIGKP